MATRLTVTPRVRELPRPADFAGDAARPGRPDVPRDPVTLTIEVPGRHNALNAAAALGTGVELGVPPGTAGAGLAAYRGARGRMEPKGEVEGVRVLDSYAHHPTELAADLTAARDIAEGGRVIAVFQPHLYSRTRIFAAEFGAVLGLADEALVLDVYAAREDPEPRVTGMIVAAEVPRGRGRFVPDAAAVRADRAGHGRRRSSWSWRRPSWWGPSGRCSARACSWSGPWRSPESTSCPGPRCSRRPASNQAPRSPGSTRRASRSGSSGSPRSSPRRSAGTGRMQ